jgi:hypothetical protein
MYGFFVFKVLVLSKYKKEWGINEGIRSRRRNSEMSVLAQGMSASPEFRGLAT